MEKLRRLDGFWLKIIALVAVTLSYAAVIFSPLSVVSGYISGISFPIFAFLITEGYKHTKNVYIYMLRLLVFALIATYPYYLWQRVLHPISENPYYPLTINALFSYLAGLIAIYAAHMISRHIKNAVLRESLMLVSVAVISFLAYQTQYGIAGVWFIYILWRFKNKHLGFWIGLLIYFVLPKSGISFILYTTHGPTVFFLTSLFPYLFRVYLLPFIIAYPIILLYNGKRGINIKYLFYIYTPVMLMVANLLYKG